MERNRGFTLIELIIVVALVSVVAMLLYSFLGQGFHLYAMESESADEQTSMRQVMSDITNKSRIEVMLDSFSCDSGILTIGDYSYTLSGDKVMRNGSAIASGIQSFEFSIASGILEISIVSTSGTELSTAISLFEKKVS